MSFTEVMKTNLLANAGATAFIVFLVLPAFISAKSTLLVWMGIGLGLTLIAYHLNAFKKFKSPVNQYLKEQLKEINK